MLGFDPFSEFPLSTLTGVTFVGVTGVYATSELGLVFAAANADAPVVGTGAQTYLGSETANAGASVSLTGLPATLYLGIINGNATQINSWVDVITNTSENYIVDEGPMFGGASFSAVPFSGITQTTHVAPALNTWVDVNVTQLPNWHV
tara:strand:+ start:544 stop:987 length:444 start_codon:yes stop_codon:yes gene_type:complete